MCEQKLKLLEEKIGTTLERTGVGVNFMNKTPIAQQLRERIDIWDCNKLKGFCTVKKQALD
jgi:hypothetical protein